MKRLSQLVLTALIIFAASRAHARFTPDVLVRGEITGIDGKFVILALKSRLVMVPRTSILKRYPVRVGERVVARLPLNTVKVTGKRKPRR
ncbi:MAG TPA: hypothetical protein VFV50_03150 [Bdellovibrionales bacterium]|nr:hypothetical protein [Bdellovibrionales bacterium]